MSSDENAAIAQSVERILGKDEVASSNLASSSIRKPHPTGWGFLMDNDRFEPSKCNSPVDCCRRRLDGGEPFHWIVLNVLPYFVIIPLITDHMVVIGTLENLFSFGIGRKIDLLCDLIFVPTNYGS